MSSTEEETLNTEVDRVLKMIKGKDAISKIRIIHIMLGVTIDDCEISLSETILRGIIFARILRTCPACKGQFKLEEYSSPCPLCKDKGAVTGVEEEKYLLKHLAAASL